ncbi:MAG: amidohydrolase [Defluviitaleaceae bacterium]|nr:amidohydrolase [Defluviitaleaceae bacterium]
MGIVIDMHVHIGTFRVDKIKLSLTVDEAVEWALRTGCDKICCTSITSLYYDYAEGDRIIREGMARHPGIVLGYATVTTPRHGAPQLEHLKRCFFGHGFHGMKIYSHTQGIGTYESNISITDEYMDPIYEFASKYRIPLLAHSTPEQCDVVCGKFPEARLIMAHMGATQIARGQWHAAIAVAKRRPNLYLDTTSSGMDLGMVEEAVGVVGAGRIMWGSDAPLLDVWYNKEKILAAEITEEQKDLILGENFLRLAGEIIR